MEHRQASMVREYLRNPKLVGLTAFSAWKDYQQGKLQSRSRSGMSMDEWAELKKEQSTASGFNMTQTSDVREFIGQMMTKEQAATRGITSKEWEAMVIDRLNHVKLSAVEFNQLETYYGLELKGGKSNTTGTDGSSAQKMSYAEYREKTAPQKIVDLNTEVTQYFRAYQAFANSAVYDSQHVNYQNAKFMLESRIRTAAELRKRADALLTSLETSGDIISGDYSELLAQISSTREGVDSIMDVFEQQANDYSRWDTEDTFNKATEWSKQYYDNWAHYVNADDFDYYSAKGAAIENPTMDAAERDGRFLWWEWEGDDIGNIVTYSRENADMLAMAYGNGQETKGNYKYRSMSDMEVAIYNYLLGKGWEDKANEFLSFMDEELNAREGGELAKRITGIDIPVAEDLAIVLYGLGAGVDQWASGTRQLFTNELQPTTVEQYANSEIANSLDGFGKYAYTAANAIGNMAPSILLSYVTAGLGAPAAVAKGIGAAAVGMSVAGNAYGSALEDGYSVGQARAYSTLVGAAEATLQYILGGIGSLGGVTDDLIKAKINMIDNSLLRIAAKLGVDVFSEVPEEELQNFLEPAFRSIIFGEAYDAPTINEMLETAVVTAGTTLLLGGGDTVRGDLSENIRLVESGQKITGTDGGMDALMNLANEVAGVSSEDVQRTLTNQIDKVSQNATARNVGQLNATVQAANDQVKQAEVAKSLMSKGVSSKKADGIAEAIVARLNGQELTRMQRNILTSALENSAVRDTISELIKKKSNGIDSVQNDVYDNSNIRDGITNEEKAASWNLPNQSVDTFSNHDYATVTEDSPIRQAQNTSSEGVFGVDADVIDNVITDGSHLENGKLKPNVTYKTGEHDYYYTTNEDGLIVNARTDDLQLKTHEGRYKHDSNTYGKEPGDHAGHLFGDRFGGSPELDNLVSQAKNVNLSEYKAIENQWAKALENGQTVRVNIDIHYEQGGVRPISFDVSYTIDGKRYYRKISNQLGGSK